MTVNEFLKQYQDLGISIEERQEEIEKLRARAISISPPATTNSGSHSKVQSDKVGLTVSKIVDETTALADDIEKFLAIRKEIIEIIESLPERKDREILRKKYILGKNAEQIAEELGYCRRQITRRVKKSLKKCEEIFGDVL